MNNIELLRHEDFIQNFTLHKSSIGGCIVRMSSVIDTILNRHDNPPIVNNLLGEMVTLAAMLSAKLANKSILTMQIRGDGLVKLLVVDVVSDGNIRAYAELDKREGDALSAVAEGVSLHDIVGNGYLAITLDSGVGTPYQGIVSLEGNSIVSAVEHYFNQSQQLNMLFHLFVNKRVREDGSSRWRAGGIMLEQMPNGSSNMEENIDSDSGGVCDDTDRESNSWDYNKLLVKTATEDELLDPHLASSALLYRLFNEGGVWIEDISPIPSGCRCSRDKIKAFLKTMSEEDIKNMQQDGVISVTCQFCNNEEIFDEKDIEML